ncbi:uncharacterized protein METZ01_LOCUS255689, partial [marine metagenome]
RTVSPCCRVFWAVLCLRCAVNGASP